MIVLAFVVLLLPGFAWWAWLGKRDQDPIVSLGQIIGVSLTSIALFAQALFLINIRVSTTLIVIISTILAALCVGGIIKKGVRLSKQYHHHLWIGLLLFAAAIIWRLVQAQDLLLPNWVDSQHHFLIIRVFLEQRGLPNTLSPYLEMPFFYHYGFHSAAALFAAVSRLSIGDAIILLGQALNAAIGLSIYALGKALFKDWHPAAAAALLVSFATRMPPYYLSWGRYPLTAGMILLPLAMALAIENLSERRQQWGWLSLALLIAGVLLSHYFTAVLLALFLIILALVYLVPRWSTPLTALIKFSHTLLGTIVGSFLALPWLLRVARYSSASPGVRSNLPESLSAFFAETGQYDYITNLLGPISNHILIIIALIGLIIALVLKKSNFAFGIWSVFLGLTTLPTTLTLRPFRADHFAIILFLPITLWAGWLFWWLGQILAKKLKRDWLATGLVGALIIAWIAWSVPLNLGIVNPRTVLADQDDLDALNWVAENMPEDARFFINTAHWLKGTYRGVDGGGWLLPYTGRFALVPTIFYGFSPEKDAIRELRDWGERASQVTACSSEFWDLVREANLDWVYIKEGVGAMQPAGLAGCEGIQEAYANSKVRVYQITGDK
ncbi:MAG: DUF6541 family protein [Brevefilum sp.]